MLNEELPDEFDIIVIGTGLSESILSGALSRIGKKVLHLDHNKYYGSSWSSFNLRAFETWIHKIDDVDARSTVDDISQKINSETEELVVVENIRKTTEQGRATCYLSDPPEQPILSLSQDVEIKDEAKTEDNLDKPSSVTESEKIVSASGDAGLGDDKIFTDKSSSDSDEIDQKTVKDENATASQEPESQILDNTEQVQADTDAKQIDEKDKTEVVAEDDVVVETVGENAGILKNLAKDEKAKPTVDKDTKEYFYSKWRHYSLDLAPKLMFSRGKLVELLITSNVCRYLEFRNVTRTLTLLNDGTNTTPQKLAPVPCSRTDVFTSKFVTMIEKRMLMRVLTMCANYENHPEEYREFENRKFIEFLAAKKLSKKLQHFILHSISMVSEDTNTLDGLKATQKFLKSLGRYGNSAFLWPLYGVGELPQAFCRLGAVFGGTFCLSRSLHAIIVNKENGRCVGIIDSAGHRLRCEQLILDECYIPESHRVRFANIVSRAIYVTDSSLLHADKENVSLITIPPTSELSPSRLIEVGSSSCVCPPKHYVVHAMTRIQTTSGETLPSPQSKFHNMEKILFENIEPIVKKVDFTEETQKNEETNKESSQAEESRKPQVLWSAYFNMMSGGVDTGSLPDNVYVTKGPSMDLGFDGTISEAQRLFEAICPDEEFLPRAPNPDEIIYFDQDDEGYNTETNGAAAAIDHQQQQEEGEYQEDESEVDAGAGEPPDQEEVPSAPVQPNRENEVETG